MFLLVLAYPGCPGQYPESCKTVVVVVVVVVGVVVVVAVAYTTDELKPVLFYNLYANGLFNCKCERETSI